MQQETILGKRRKSQRFVGRGGDKLDGALADLDVDVGEQTAADLGANVGGFTDCLLQCGARRVYAVDTGYGVLDWRLRQDERVAVLERTNALHVRLPEPVDLVVADVGWTPLGHLLPRALTLLKDTGFAVVLLKPQYEADPLERRGGVVYPECVAGVVARVVKGLAEAGIQVKKHVPSRILGSGGNQEFFLLIEVFCPVKSS